MIETSRKVLDRSPQSPHLAIETGQEQIGAFIVTDDPIVEPPNNARVIQIRNNISTARRIMRRDYKRDIVGVPGVGVRATVDELDIVQTAAVRDAKTVDRAARKFSDTVDLVNTEEFKLLVAQSDNPSEFKELTEWWVRDVQSAIKKLRSSIKNNKLLPQPPELAEK